MLGRIIFSVINTTTSTSSVVKPMGCRMPDPEFRVKWDPKSGKVKIEEKKKNPFIVY